MNDHQTMKVTWIDPDQRALFVPEDPLDGSFHPMSQKGKDAPRKLQSKGYIDPDGYQTFDEAQKALSHHVSVKRSSGPWYRWEIVVNGKTVSENEYHEMCNGHIPAPMELPPNAPVTLANIEYRIALHIQSAYDNMLEVGRCLIEAKESDLVPHGEWEGWVRRNTEMTERQAQRLMQAARSVTPGSMLERLSITKIQALLALPEPEREPMAKKAADDGMSLRELQAEVKKQTERAKAAENQAKIYDRIKQQAEENLRKADDRANERWKLTIQNLRDDLAEAQKSAPAQGVSPEAQAEIDRLKAALTDAEAEAEEQANLRQKAQRDLLDQQTQAARNETQPEVTALTAYGLASAVRVFIGTAGVLPHMGKALEKMSQAEKEAFRQQVDIISRWTDASEQALNMICSVAIIEEQGDGV